VLRITRIRDDAGGICLKVEGRLAAAWVALLESELEGARRERVPLSLDLGAVDFASAQAIDLLRAEGARGVTLRACSPFLSNLLAVNEP
jgi:anti-anti-sigma regulatory factor